MSTDDLVNSYRLFDTQAASLETNLLVRHELLLARKLAAKTSIHRIQAPAVLVLLTSTGGAPALFSILPDGRQQYVWTSVFLLVSVGLLLKLGFDYYSSSKDLNEIEELMPQDDNASLSSKPWFIQSKIGTYGTRLSLASQILKCNDLSPTRRKKFEQIKDWWTNRIDEELEEAERLKTIGYLDQSEYDEIQSWAISAKDQD